MFVDVFVLIVVFISILIAFFRGFIREVLTIFGIGGGMAAAYIGGPLFSPMMRVWMGISEDSDPEKFLGAVPYPLLADILAYGVILVVFILILSVISHFLASFAKNVGLGALDRTLGVIFGFVRGVLVLGLLYLPFYYLAGDEQKETWFTESKTHMYLEASSKLIDGVLPRSVADNIKDGADTAVDMSETRKKLEEMDLLKSTPDNENEGETSNKTDGYTPEFRQDMDDLFENNADDPSIDKK